MNEYSIVAGTFDRLHDGHKSLLKAALMSTLESKDYLIVGIMDDAYASAKCAHCQSYNLRKLVVEEYLYGCLIEADVESLTYWHQFEVKSLDNSDNDLGYEFKNIFVSKDVAHRLIDYRERRRENYNIVVFPTIYDGDEPVSSTSIRSNNV